MAALVLGEQLSIEAIGERAHGGLDVGQRDFGDGVFGQQLLGGGELHGFDLGLSGFEGRVEEGELGEEFVESVVFFTGHNMKRLRCFWLMS